MPREEATKIVNIVKAAVSELEDIPNIYELIPCGSYRRGKQFCGDVDILISRKHGNVQPDFMNHLIDKLDK